MAFEDREDEEPESHAQEIQRPYPEDASQIKVADFYFTEVLLLYQQQVGDEKAAQHEEEIHAQITIAKQKKLDEMVGARV